MKKAVIVTVTTLLAAAAVFLGVVAIFPGIPSYVTARAVFTDSDIQVKEYEYSNLQFVYDTIQTSGADFTMKLPSEYELYSEDDNTRIYKRASQNEPTVIVYINFGMVMQSFFADDMYIDEENGIDAQQSAQKAAQMRQLFTEEYGASPESYYQCKKAVLQIDFSDYRLRDKAHSELCLALMSAAGSGIQGASSVTFVENAAINAIVTHTEYEGTGRTMISAEFYSKDGNTPHFVTFMCENESEIKDAYRAINSIEFVQGSISDE